MSAVCCSGVPGVVTVGAFVEATLFGGLGIDGKKASLDPLGRTVPLVGKVGDPGEEEKSKLDKNFMCEQHHMADFIWDRWDWIIMCCMSRVRHQMSRVPEDLRFLRNIFSFIFAGDFFELD